MRSEWVGTDIKKYIYVPLDSKDYCFMFFTEKSLFFCLTGTDHFLKVFAFTRQ